MPYVTVHSVNEMRMPQLLVFLPQLLVAFTKSKRDIHAFPYFLCRYLKLAILKIMVKHVWLSTCRLSVLLRDVSHPNAQTAKLSLVPFLQGRVALRI